LERTLVRLLKAIASFSSSTLISALPTSEIAGFNNAQQLLGSLTKLFVHTNDSIKKEINMKNAQKSKIGLMAPLIIGDPSNLNCDYSLEKWAEFRTWLDFKKRGKRAPSYISVDVWMGLVNPEEDVFVWSYYRKLFTTIIEYGFKIVPIMSFHQCGGNIGDTVYQPVPAWLWKKMMSLGLVSDVSDLRYVSEYNNACIEYPSAWMIHLAVPFFKKMMSEFQNEFADMAEHFCELNVSCGPAGELRNPSYNSHDANDPNHCEGNVAGYPFRGTLQCYSNPAKASFLKYVLTKYGTLEKVAQAWGRDVSTLPAMIIPPADTATFFGANEAKYTQYGRDVFDWNHECLMNVGRLVIGGAIDVFGAEGAAFAGIDIGAKVPGIHWGMGVIEDGVVKLGNRFPELTAGLIRTSDDWSSDEAGRGYRSIISLFKELQASSPRSRIVVHFTCLEMGDGREGADKQSLAHTMVCYFGEEAQRQGVVAKGENALNFTLADAAAWGHMRSVLKPSAKGLYAGLTILRVSDVQEGVAAQELESLMEFVEQSAEPAVNLATEEAVHPLRAALSAVLHEMAGAGRPMFAGNAGLAVAQAAM
jgi:beta-amylase